MDTENAMIAFAQALIRQPSVSGEEGPAVQLVIREMQRLGYDEAWIDEQGNAVGVWKGARAGRTILLDGHIDTVGIAPGTWRHEPFGAEIEDGYLYGRGAADMKGAIAAMVYGVASTPRDEMAGRAVVTASVMEENLEGAALQPVVAWAQPDIVVIGEATGLNLARGGRGRAEIHLETIGRPAHSSTPHLGRNAVHDMIRVIEAIEATPPPHDRVLGPGIWALTDIISDPYPAYSVIASRCRATYDHRLLPGETVEGLMAHLHALPISSKITLEARIAQGEHQTYTGALAARAEVPPGMAVLGCRTVRAGSAGRAARSGVAPETGCVSILHQRGIHCRRPGYPYSRLRSGDGRGCARSRRARGTGSAGGRIGRLQGTGGERFSDIGQTRKGGKESFPPRYSILMF